VIKILAYTPSTIAAAAVLWVTNQTIDGPKLECFHSRMDKASLKTLSLSSLYQGVVLVLVHDKLIKQITKIFITKKILKPSLYKSLFGSEAIRPCNSD
jgi:hypothetical protein